MTEKFRNVFKTDKPIIGMLHLLGDTRHEIVDNAIEEMKMMTKHGVSAVLVENYFGEETDVENVLAVLQKDYPDVVYGVNVLGDMETAFSFAKKYDAKFIQVDSICGHLYPESEKKFYERVDAMRADYDGLLLGGVRFKYQPVYSGRSLEEDLEIGKQHCDVIVVTGAGTGVVTDLEKIREFRTILKDFPLVVGAGITDQTVIRQLRYSDGGIVGSFFKKNGDAYGYMDEERVNRFCNVVKEVIKDSKDECAVILDKICPGEDIDYEGSVWFHTSDSTESLPANAPYCTKSCVSEYDIGKITQVFLTFYGTCTHVVQDSKVFIQGPQLKGLLTVSGVFEMISEDGLASCGSLIVYVDETPIGYTIGEKFAFKGYLDLELADHVLLKYDEILRIINN